MTSLESPAIPPTSTAASAVFLVYGQQAPARLQDAHVAVAGLGGVGSWTVEALARCGVGALTLIDLDHIAESNVNRQIHALTQTLGQSRSRPWPSGSRPSIRNAC